MPLNNLEKRGDRFRQSGLSCSVRRGECERIEKIYDSALYL